MHKNKKRFVCEQCGSAFNAHYTLKEHRAYVHSDVRKYPCSKCGKSFKARNALIRHEQVHSDKRPFQCHCGQMYKRSSHLRRHLATSHQGEDVDGSQQIELEKNTWEEERMEQNWEEEQQSKYKTGSWESSREHKMGLTASVALDVVTSLDLNMRPVEPKQEKDSVRQNKVDKVKAGAGHAVYPDREAREARGQGSSSSFQLEQKVYEYRAPFPQHKPFPAESHRFHGDRYMGLQGDNGNRYYQGVVGRSDKVYPSPEKEYQTHDKLYIPSQEKNYPPLPPPTEKNYSIPQVTEKSFPGPGKNFSHPPGGPEKVYLSPAAAPGPSDRAYSLDDRAYTQIPSRPPHDHSQMGGGRVLAPLDPMFSDSGPADLTMAGPRSDLAAPRPSDHQLREDLGLYSRVSQSGPRQRYSNYLNQRHVGDSVGRNLSYHPHPSYPARLQDSSRSNPAMDHSRLHLDPSRTQHHLNTALSGRPLDSLPPVPLDALDDSYRPLPDLGYSQRQSSHYFDQLDSYLQHQGREEVEVEQGCDKKKYFKSEKYYRGEHDVVGLHHHRDEGGLLPPLLALAPQHPGGGPPSPHSLKMDYLCTQSDHISTQYLGDTTMDYNNIDYN
jgi:DNA-directed RNA polymerase subunit RPC12/RpoP